MTNQTNPTATYTGDIPRTPLRFLWWVTKPHQHWMWLALLLVFIASLLGQASFYFIKLIIDAATTGKLDAALTFGLIYPLWTLVEHFFWRGSGFMGMKWATSSNKYAYNHLVQYTMNHGHTYFSDRFAGSLLSKVTNVVNAIEELIVDGLWTHFNTFISVSVTLGFLASVDLFSAGLFAGLIIVLIIINKYFAPLKKQKSLESAASATALRGYIVDMFTNVAAVRQFSRKVYETEQLEKFNETYRDKHSKSWIYTEKILLINGTLLSVCTFGVFYTLLHRLSEGSITLGDFVFVMSLISSLGVTLIFIGRAFNNTARSIGEAKEGLDDLLLAYDVKDAAAATLLTAVSGEVAFTNVNFEYGQNQVFKDFNLTITPGQRIGLVGPSGAGKTTFVSLLLRQHDLTSGAIMIDGQNIAEVTQDSLREAIAVVPQEPLLFHRTIRENIAYGKPHATDEEIIAVAKKAQAHDFISALPEQYETLVGERGVKLSGGQKQRVAIARAMLKDAPILVLDEATSALDSESEVEIQKALHFLMVGKTVVAIAHRLSTLREMDRIIVLENGKIVEDGTHETLKSAGGTYERLWNHQAGGFLQE